MLGLGGLLLLGGRAADLLGRRRVLFAALAVFTVASLAGGLVDDPALLIAARFVKGAAAAFTVPAALSLITTTFTEGPGRNKALAIFNAFGASGFSFGLVFGGLLTSADWRLTFLLPVPVAAILLFLIPRYIAKDRPYLGAKRQYDLPGAVLLTAGMLVLVHALVEERVWEGLLALVAARRLRHGRAPDAAAARAPRHLPQRLAGAREPGRDVPVRRVRRLPVRRHPVPAGHARLERARDGARLPPWRPVRRVRRPAHGRGHQPLRHDEADPGLDRRLRGRLRALPAGRRLAVLGSRCSR